MLCLSPVINSTGKGSNTPHLRVARSCYDVSGTSIGFSCNVKIGTMTTDGGDVYLLDTDTLSKHLKSRLSRAKNIVE
jgi:hypothetical protein